jgi:tetratricopeptide (TPR) repeat protein
LAADPAHGDAANNLAAELLVLERWEAARACLEQALAADPRNPHLLGKLASR